MRRIHLFLFLLCSLSSLAKVPFEQGHVVYIYEDYSLKIEGDKVFIIRKTYSDADKICLSKYKKQLLPFSSRGAHMIGTHDTTGNLIANEQYYYKVYWGWDDKITTIPLFPTAMVTDHFGENCFKLQGRWYHVKVEEQQVVKTFLPGFPEHPSVIEETPKGCLLRDEQFVYSYDRETLVTEKLKELNVKNVRFHKLASDYSMLYDEDTFYAVRYWNGQLLEWVDITQKIRGLGLKKKFTEGTFIISQKESGYPEYLIDFKDERLWLWGDPLAMRNEKLLLVPLSSTYIDKLDWVEKSGGYYKRVSDYLDGRPPLDLSPIKHPKDLYLVKYKDSYDVHLDLYHDGAQYYAYAEGFHPIQIEKRLVEALTAPEKYSNYHRNFDKRSVVQMALVRDTLVVYELTDWCDAAYLKREKRLPLRILKEIPLTAPLKDLSVCYATPNELLIGAEVIPHQADFETLSFIACIEKTDKKTKKTIYHCYFKDKNNTYEYSTDRKSLILIKPFDEDKILSIKK